VIFTKVAYQTNFMTSFPVTGMRLSKIEDTTVRESSNVLDLHVFRDTLVVPRCDEKKVLLYQLA